LLTCCWYAEQGGEENLGPLENTIRNLNKETDSHNEECKELEREWLNKQTSMVALLSEVDKLNEVNREYKARFVFSFRVESDQVSDGRLHLLGSPF
jgi:uncharacterized coiled-coil DUF342 family protein